MRLAPRLLTLLVALAGLVWVPAAQADGLTVSGTLTTPAARFTAATTTDLYYLQLHSGAVEERFSVKLVPPAFATLGGLDEGQSIDGPLAIALQGPGTIGQQTTDGQFAAPCSVSGDHSHGYATGDTSVDVLLPPHSDTTLAVRYRSGRSVPWIDTDARLTFVVEPKLVGTYPAGSPFSAGPTVTTAQTWRTAGPLVSGRVAAHVLVSSSPAGTVGSIERAAKTIGRRSTVRLSGRVLPAVAGKKVTLQWARGTGTRHTIATVRTDRRGHFTAPAWTPGRAGGYELWATYPKQSGSLAPDQTSCPVRFAAR